MRGIFIASQWNDSRVRLLLAVRQKENPMRKLVYYIVVIAIAAISSPVFASQGGGAPHPPIHALSQGGGAPHPTGGPGR